MTRTYRYLHYDVFTDTPLEGNQLAVFPEPAGLSDALMQEVRYDNIRVSCVMPGSVATGFGRGRPESPQPADWKLAPEDVAQVVLDLIAHPARSLPSRVELRPSKPLKR